MIKWGEFQEVRTTGSGLFSDCSARADQHSGPDSVRTGRLESSDRLQSARR